MGAVRYNNKRLIPAPFVGISKDYQKSGQQKIGSLFTFNVQGKLFPNNSMLVHPYGYKDPWYNITWFSINYKPHPATKDWLKYVGHIRDKKIMARFNNIGNTKWSGGHFHKKVKQDTNKQQKKGIIAEEIMKTEYFVPQSGVTNVELSPKIYSSWDIKFNYEKEAS